MTATIGNYISPELNHKIMFIYRFYVKVFRSVHYREAVFLTSCKNIFIWYGADIRETLGCILLYNCQFDAKQLFSLTVANALF